MWQFTVDIRQTKNISKNFIPEMAMRWYSGPNSTAEASKIRKLIMGSWRLVVSLHLLLYKDPSEIEELEVWRLSSNFI